MQLPSEYAAEFRATSDPTKASALKNELAASTRRLVVRCMWKICCRNTNLGDVEDGAQTLTIKLVARVVTRTVPPRQGEEDRYFQQAARKHAYDILKGKGVYKHRRFRTLVPTVEPTSTPFPDAERAAERARATDIMWRAFAELPDSYKTMIWTHRFEGVPLTTIAEQWLAQGKAATLQRAIQNVQATHSRAVRALRELVRKHLEQEAA